MLLKQDNADGQLSYIFCFRNFISNCYNCLSVSRSRVSICEASVHV